MMFRAATPASGGTGAPDWTYCSICPWTVFMRASTSRPAGWVSGSSSTVARRYGAVWTNPCSRIRPWPCTIARTVPSWSWTTWAILASVPTPNSSLASVISSVSAWRCVTSAIRLASPTAALSAFTLFSRPTVSGTIISGKITVSRSATSGSSRVRRSGGRSSGFLLGIRASSRGCDAGLCRGVGRRR